MLSFYFLYVLIDYSTHTKVFHRQTINLPLMVLYYAFQFVNRADILIPVALMIATIKVLTTSNMRNEIVALTTGGISLKKIVSPFLWFAALSSLFLYLNIEFLQPASLKWIDSFEERYFHGKTRSNEMTVRSLLLQDKSLLIYQNFNHHNNSFFDAYWLKNEHSIYRIKELFPYEEIPMGKWVDLLERKSNGEIGKMDSYDQLPLPGITIDPKTLFHAAYPPRMQSLSQLSSSLNWRLGDLWGKMSDREAEIATYFYFKLTLPLLCFLVVIGPVPFCLRVTRNLPTFFIFALSLFGLISFITLAKSSLILGETQVIPPLLAIVLPQMPFYLILISKYGKI